jgi:hypothetical protein
MTAILERISELEQVLAEAQQAEVDTTQQKDDLAATRARAEQIKRELQELIEKGETTGDRTLDLKFLLTGSLKKNETYDKIDRIRTAIESNPNKLVLEESSYASRWCFATLPPVPRLIIKRNPTNTWLELPVTASRQRYRDPDRPLSIPLDVTINAGSGNPSRTAIWIGTTRIRNRLKHWEPRDVFDAWLLVRELGHQLSPTPNLALEIRNRREAMVATLVSMTKLENLERQLADKKKNPVRELTGRFSRPTVTETHEGLLLDFGMTDDIATAYQNLRNRVETAVSQLEMADNPTLQEAAKKVGYPLPS